MNPEIIVCVVFAAFSIFMSVQDIKTQKVSRWCSVALLVAAVVARLVFWKGEERVGFVASACIAIVVFWAVRFITKKKLGLADVFYSGSSGALLGFDMWLASCAIACVAAACVIWFRVHRHPAQGTYDQAAAKSPTPPSASKSRKSEILREPVPFIPCLFFGAIVAKIFYFFI
ncbi:MAG: prepilin peptidase [Spirochaetaceae bacterium]|nr:prepilin peptidase [Spirochaetaceae bacterium]